MEDGYIRQKDKPVKSWLATEIEDPAEQSLANLGHDDGDEAPSGYSEAYDQRMRKTQFIQTEVLYGK